MSNETIKDIDENITFVQEKEVKKDVKSFKTEISSQLKKYTRECSEIVSKSCPLEEVEEILQELTPYCRWVDISTWTPPPQNWLYLRHSS